MKSKKRTKSAPKTRRTKKPSLFIVVPLVLISFFVIAATIYKITEFILTNYAFTNLPKLEISLTEVPLEAINSNSKSVKYPNNLITLTADNGSSTFNNVEIKGHGNSTWAQIKKPYQLKLDTKSDLIKDKPAKKWLLLANYLDPTHLRNDLAFHLEKILNEEYALSGDFVELYMNDLYEGLYYLSEKVEIGKSRVDLKDSSGIIVELDNFYTDFEDCHYDDKHNCLTNKDSVNDDKKQESTDSFLKNFMSLQSAIKNKDYKKIKSLIDIDSFAKYFLLNEFSSNVDAYSSSFYMYKDGESDQIHAGPGWDFDYSFGSYALDTPFAESNFDLLHSPSEEMALKTYLEKGSDAFSHGSSVSTILYELMEIPEFEARVREIYQETLSGKSDELLDYIKSQAEYIRPAALRDQERWKLETDFDEEIDHLVDWVAKRCDHFERTYGKNTNQQSN